MRLSFRNPIASCLVLSLGVACTAAAATEYFVSLQGCDETYDGRTRETAFASIQHGVDALEPGDTLTILPGEYFGSVRREGLGAEGLTTTIRAEIPGTVLLRGDVPLPAFDPLDGFRFVYVADVSGIDIEEAHVINELDTLTVLERAPSAAMLEFTPGRFHHDRQAARIYLSTRDFTPPGQRTYTVSVTGTHGMHLSDLHGVTIEGLSFTGFNRNALAPRHDRSQAATWGLILVDGRDCVIRDCRAYLNGRGIQVYSLGEESGDNVVERCVAWANASQYSSGDTGGITLHFPRRDVVRESVAFRNANYGINIRSDAAGAPTNDADGEPVFSQAHHENASLIAGNLTWGNQSADLKIKTGHAHVHRIENSIGDRPGSSRNIHASLFRTANFNMATDSVALNREENLDPIAEFADPVNHDYRLQSTSRFRGTGPDGGDRGPFPYMPNIFFVRPDGDDAADGLSVQAAWRSLDRAFETLRGGDSLYLMEGVYRMARETTDFEGEKPISIRARGDGRVVIGGRLRIDGAAAITFERLDFEGPLGLTGVRHATFAHCTFSGGAPRVEGAESLRVTHCIFADAPLELVRTTGLYLAGNVFAFSGAPALEMDGKSLVRYADYNLYRSGTPGWSVAGVVQALNAVQPQHERHARVADPVLASADGRLQLADPAAFAGAGPHGTTPGPFCFRVAGTTDTLRLVGPWVHSVSDTTANIEWGTSGPSDIRLDWGKTAEMGRHTIRQANRYGDFSLTGLEPDTEYFLRVTLDGPLVQVPVGDDTAVVETGERHVTIRFRTAAVAVEPRTFYVAPDGDDAQDGLRRDTAWRTVNHAASRVGPGDTVLIAGGTYAESVRVRATGESGRPIAFKAKPDEKVTFDGMGRTLDFAFFAADKSHLRFDGFYLVGLSHYSDFMPWSDEQRGRNGAFVLYESHDVHVTRCFHDGRGAGSSPGLAHARHCKDLLFENNVMLNCMGNLEIFWNSPRARIRHNVFLRNFITHFGPHIRGRRVVDDEDLCRVERNIITDNLLKKRHTMLFGGNPVMRNNAFYLRAPAGERRWRGDETFDDMLAELADGDLTLLVDPRFKGTLEMDRYDDEGTPVFLADRLMHNRDLDFPDLFATDSALVERGIGLQPDAFADFHFNLNTNEQAD